MSMFKSIIMILLMIFLLSIAAQTLPAAEKNEYANQPISNSLRGKHNIALNAGVLAGMAVPNDVSAGGETNRVEGTEFLGSIGYSYWLENDLAVNLSLGLLSLDVTN
jgi:hypothetical protein